jgi:hypothetical protein
MLYPHTSVENAHCYKVRKASFWPITVLYSNSHKCALRLYVNEGTNDNNGEDKYVPQSGRRHNER